MGWSRKGLGFALALPRNIVLLKFREVFPIVFYFFFVLSKPQSSHLLNGRTPFRVSGQGYLKYLKYSTLKKT